MGDALPDMCVMFHNSVHHLSARFLAQQRRHYYVTPTSYLELLGSYKSLLGRKQVGGGDYCASEHALSSAGKKIAFT